jgi:hypothetical protein
MGNNVISIILLFRIDNKNNKTKSKNDIKTKHIEIKNKSSK